MNWLIITPSGAAPLTVQGRDTLAYTHRYYVGHYDTTGSETETFSEVNLSVPNLQPVTFQSKKLMSI